VTAQISSQLVRLEMGKSLKSNVVHQQNAQNSSQGKENSKSGNEERVGDWVCINCANLNFSFRNNCNRCQRDRYSSASVLQSEDELKKFQKSGGAAQYILTKTNQM
jgi:hypothetical protein